MLSLAFSCGAPPRKHALLPAQSTVACLSTAVDLKTATCNSHCNSHQHKCPQACFCLPPSNPQTEEVTSILREVGVANLSPTLSSEDFTMLVSALERRDGASLNQKASEGKDGDRKECVSIDSTTRDGWCNKNCNNDPPQCPENLCSCDGSVASSAPAKKAANAKKLHSSEKDTPFVPAKLPDEVVGFYMKAWSCTGSADTNLNVWDCSGPAERKNGMRLRLRLRPRPSPLASPSPLALTSMASPLALAVNVWFSGLGALGQALGDSGVLAGEAGGCLGKDEGYCERQVKANMPWGADKLNGTEMKRAREDAIAKVLAPNGWNAARCNACLAEKGEETDEDRKAAAHTYPPYNTKLAFRQGVQFVALGGASGEGTITVGKLKKFTDEDGAQLVKNAGFHGVCFDIELTAGEEDLVEAMEKTFKVLKEAGLLTMVTTSHSAPYAASSDKAKNMIVESWINSNDIDIFSPQLYTSGSESAPELEPTHCNGAYVDGNLTAPVHKSSAELYAEYDERKRAEREKDRLKKERDRMMNGPGGSAWAAKHPSNCTYERLKPMKTMWIPSIVREDQYPAVKEFFAGKGITTKGFIQWK